MIQGASSDAGESMGVAGLCRAQARQARAGSRQLPGEDLSPHAPPIDTALVDTSPARAGETLRGQDFHDSVWDRGGAPVIRIFRWRNGLNAPCASSIK
jgi:hypothetical protein